MSHLPILVDPSHGTGKRDAILPMARAAIAAGADGLLVEVHHQPDKALSDGPQSLYPEQFARMVDEIVRSHPLSGDRCRAEFTLQNPRSRRMTSGTQKALALAVGLAGLAPLLTGCRKQDFPQYPASYREYVYVTNGQSGTLTVLDAVNLRLDREIRVGVNPVAVAANPTRNEVYVVNAGAESGAGFGLGDQCRE